MASGDPAPRRSFPSWRQPELQTAGARQGEASDFLIGRPDQSSSAHNYTAFPRRKHETRTFAAIAAFADHCAAAQLHAQSTLPGSKRLTPVILRCTSGPCFALGRTVWGRPTNFFSLPLTNGGTILTFTRSCLLYIFFSLASLPLLPTLPLVAFSLYFATPHITCTQYKTEHSQLDNLPVLSTSLAKSQLLPFIPFAHG